MSSQTAEKILELARSTEALVYGRFKLSAGGTSPYYFDGRLITLHPEGAYSIANAMLPVLKECEADTVAGPTLGADPIVASIVTASFQQRQPISGLIVRKEAKRHGGKRAIEGPLKKNARVMVVDDTCTTGSSLLMAIDALEVAGCQVVKVACVLDRCEGGSTEIRSRGYTFLSILEADEKGRIVPSDSFSKRD